MHSRIYCKNKYLQITQLYSQKKDSQFLNIVSTMGDTQKYMDQKYVLALVFANAFEITKFAELKHS